MSSGFAVQTSNNVAIPTFASALSVIGAGCLTTVFGRGTDQYLVVKYLFNTVGVPIRNAYVLALLLGESFFLFVGTLALLEGILMVPMRNVLIVVLTLVLDEDSMVG